MNKIICLPSLLLAIMCCSNNEQKDLSLFSSDEGKRIYLERYEKIVNKWTAEKEDIFINTSFGLTHVIYHPNQGKPALLLFHAAGVSAASWYANFDSLSNHFQLLVIDTPGDAGKSVLYDSTLSVKSYNKWILDILDHFNLQKAILCGHSIGGFIAANFSISYPQKIEKLILLAPAATFMNFKLPILMALKLGGKAGKGPSAEKTLRMQAHKSFVPDPDFVNLMNAVREYCTVQMIFPFKLTDGEITKISVPTLILFPEHEVIYNAGRAYRRAVNLLPDAAVELIAESGHTIIMEQDETVNQKIINFGLSN